MKKISIPEPCHENWADFTPTQKGAFCGSCQIDVVDFSNKSAEEVKTILQENSGKHMCGRFKKTQLDNLNQNYAVWQNQTSRSFQSKFLYACLIVFGMTLFTGCTLNEGLSLQSFNIELNGSSNHQLNVLKHDVETDTTKKPIKYSNHIKGKVAYTPNEEVEQPIKTCSVPDSMNNVKSIPQERMILGEIAFIEPDTATSLVPMDTLFDDIMIDGEIRIDSDFIEYIDDTTSTKNPTTNDSEPNQGDKNETIDLIPVFESKLYPNPVVDKTTIVINVNETNMFDIYLYAIDGKRIKSIFNGNLFVGRKEILINLSAYQAGSYLVVITSNNQKETLRIEKVE